MKKLLTGSAAAAFALAMSLPAFAGGGHCSGDNASASSASDYSCAGHASHSAAWSGAWLERTSSGAVSVAEVAKNSPAAKAGLKRGDIVVAVNGYDLSDSQSHAMCASKASCTVGSTVSYKVQRGAKTKSFMIKLEKMPADATGHFASRQADFDPALAAVVMTSVN